MGNTKLEGTGVKPIDYRELLIKYMDHVGIQEGTCFTGTSLDGSNQFTDEEKKELRLLEKENDRQI